jgi:hypothetical protein
MASIYSDLNRKDSRANPRVTDFDAVINALENAITQPPRQRLFRPNGGNFDDLLFKLDVDTEFRIKTLLYTLSQGEPRARLVYNETIVEPYGDPTDRRIWRVIAKFRIKGFEQQTFTRVAFLRGNSR